MLNLFKQLVYKPENISFSGTIVVSGSFETNGCVTDMSSVTHLA